MYTDTDTDTYIYIYIDREREKKVDCGCYRILAAIIKILLGWYSYGIIRVY